MLQILAKIGGVFEADRHPQHAVGDAKSRARFGYVERMLAGRGRKLEDSNIAEMEALWQEAKR